MRKKGIFALFAAFALLFTSCAAKPLYIGEEDNGKEITVKEGAVFYVKLRSNPTTGYDWYIKSVPENIEPMGAKDYIPDKTKKSVVGSGGYTVFEFKAAKKGSGVLSLVYKRNWEGELPSSQRFSVKINVP